MKKRFLRLFQQATDSVDAQDALIKMYEETAMIGGGYALSDAEARSTFENILGDAALSNDDKVAYLAALDVAIQNHHPAGMAAEIIS